MGGLGLEYVTIETISKINKELSADACVQEVWYDERMIGIINGER